MKSPTTEDVSRLAGVSVMTVSRVFNHEPALLHNYARA
ncbi:LacI family DNA-binding transcriptional regulator [Sphingomonas sp. UYP23]